MTEDKVSRYAENALGFNDSEEGVTQGGGQLTTFKELRFETEGKYKKPDGWYLPDDKTKVAIIVEAKSSKEDVYNPAWIEEMTRNVRIASQKYKRVVGILYNGKELYVVKYDGTSMNTGDDIVKVEGLSKDLQHKSYYLALFNENKIDKQKIYELTKKINDCMHFKFGIKNLYHRMIFTACALVAKRFDAKMVKGQSYLGMKYEIEATLQRQDTDSKEEKEKIDFLLEEVLNFRANIGTFSIEPDAGIDPGHPLQPHGYLGAWPAFARQHFRQVGPAQLEPFCDCALSYSFHVNLFTLTARACQAENSQKKT